MTPSIRLLVAAVVLLPLAAPLRAQGWEGRFTPAERQELMGYRLTMDNISKTAEAGAKLDELAKKNPALKDAMGKEEPKSLTGAIEKMGSVPEVRSTIESSGLTTKQFMLTIIELASTRAAIKLQAMGGNAAKAAAKMPTSPQNLKFYADHQADIEPLADKIMSSGKSSDN